MRSLAILSAAAIIPICSAAFAAPIHNISTATGLFSPSFRGTGEYTTWFGWSTGTFDGTPDNERIDDPLTTLGTLTVGASLNQVNPAQDILASSNNIYTGVAQNSQTAALTLVVPTSGVAVTGFTTIIIQGVTNTAGSFASAQQLIQNKPVFNDITVGSDTYSPEFTIAVNAATTGQWFVKYVIPGNQPMYTINIDLPGGLATEGRTPISIAGFVVDSVWAAQAAGDVALVPEPASLSLLAVAGVALIRRRKTL